MRMIFGVLAFVFCFGSVAWGAVHHVSSEGGDEYFSSIIEAVNYAVSGDTIIVGPGQYAAFDSRGKSLAFISKHGDAETCWVRQGLWVGGAGTETLIQDISFFQSVGNVAIRAETGSFTFRRCRFNSEAYVRMDGRSLVIESCVIERILWSGTIADTVQIFDTSFTDGTLGLYSPEAITFSDNVSLRHRTQLTGVEVRVSNSEFRDNISPYNGAALSVGGGLGVVAQCRFFNNKSEGYQGGALSMGSTRAFVLENLFVGNEGSKGGAVSFYLGIGTFVGRCTFIDNTSEWGSAIYFGEESAYTRRPVLQHSILVYQRGDAPVRTHSGLQPLILNTNIYGNEGGDWIEEIEDQVHGEGNISGNPCFCNMDGGEYGLCADSPCRPENNPGGEELMGAVEQGCPACQCAAPIATDKKTMGGLKSLYR